MADSDTTDCGSFFDHVDDLLDVPDDDDTGCSWLPICLHTFPCSDSVFSNSAELSVPPYDDGIVHMEWLTTFGEDSFSCGLSFYDPPTGDQLPDHGPSVLDSTGSCSPENSGTVTVGVSRCARARSKRAHLRNVSFQHVMVPHLPVPSGTAAYAESESSAESRLVIRIPKGLDTECEKKTKRKKIKFSLPSEPERKCLHCEITETPQWRAGPMGPKTLCNACGVRYKSGRLFPEYRPAASPTFLPSIHSNSHKKVLEMRNNEREHA